MKKVIFICLFAGVVFYANGEESTMGAIKIEEVAAVSDKIEVIVTGSAINSTTAAVTTEAVIEVKEPEEMIAARNGDKFYEAKDYDSSIAEYTKAIQLKGDSEIFYNNRGLAYFAKKEYENAIKDFTTAVSIKKD